MNKYSIANRIISSICLVGLLVVGTSCEKDSDTAAPMAELTTYNNIQLSSKQEVPANTSTATGNYSLVYDKTSNNLNYTINYTGVTPTAMHFHKGEVGVAGGVEAEVVGPYTSGMKGNIKLTDAQEADFFAGRFYLNIHSAAFPAGDIRGQAVSENKVVFSNVKLSGREEVPSNNSTGTGVFNGLYDKTTKKMDYTITLNGVSHSAMHLHKATAGVNGDVVMEISGLNGTTAAFTAAQENDLIAGNLYLNVHSASHGGGEVRGQISSDNKIVFANRLSGDQEVSPSGSSATGTIYGIYDMSTKKLSYNIAYTGVTPTSMHFHKGAAGTNGGVELEIAGPYNSGMTGAVTLNATQEADLLKSLWYVNVHSAAHPGGEIRAQLVK